MKQGITTFVVDIFIMYMLLLVICDYVILCASCY